MNYLLKYISVVGIVLFLSSFLAIANELSLCADTKNGYRLHYPSTWTIQQYPDSEDLVKADITKDDETGLQMRVYVNTESGLTSFLEQYVPDFDTQMRRRWGGEMTVIEQRYATFDLQRGFIISFDFIREDGTRYFFKHYLVGRDNRVYVIQCGTPFEVRSANESVFDSIVESLDFI